MDAKDFTHDLGGRPLGASPDRQRCAGSGRPVHEAPQRSSGGGRVLPGHRGRLRDELLQPHSFLEGDGRVAAVIEYDLTVMATGKRVLDEEIHLYEFGSDGEVTAFRHFLDTAKAIEAHS